MIVFGTTIKNAGLINETGTAGTMHRCMKNKMSFQEE